MNRTAVCSWSLRPADPADLVEKCRACGISAVQLWLDPVRQWQWRPDAVGSLLRSSGIAIVSGPLYRGSRIPAMRGLYVFGDFSTTFGAPDGHLFYLDPANPAPTAVKRLRLEGGAPFGLYLKGFGRDRRGEMYALASRNLGPSGTTGVVLRLATCPADFTADGFLDFFDYDAFVAAFESGDPAADLNGDDFVDFFDYDAFIAAFESGC